MIGNNGYTRGAEIGCANGATTHRLLQFCRGLTLYAVDRWEKVVGGAEVGDMGQSGCENWDNVRGEAIFDSRVRTFGKRLKKLKGDSVEMAQHVKDESLDFIFIDADHRYSAVMADLAAWIPKVKPGGIISGHDIHLSGVFKAVSEVLPDYITTGVDHVWFCRKQGEKDDVD